MDKVKVSTGILQGCFGCHIALLDLHEELLDLLPAIDILRSPINDVKEVPESDLGILDGSVCNEENAEVAKRFRERSKKILALGTCACFGGIQGLRNIFELDDVLKRAYVDSESTVDGKVPQSDEIPKLTTHVQALGQVIKVDYMLPGCPPTPKSIKEALVALVSGQEPPHPKKNLCHECGRQHKEMYVPKREFLTDTVKSVMDLDTIDESLCFLEQGLLCMGPVTREGCEARCIKGNTPCRGCMGPTENAIEQGAKMINSLANILPAGALMFLEDVVGIGYRYSLPVSIYPHLCPHKEGK